MKTRNVGDRMEVVGKAESFSVEGGMRNLQRLAAANHAGHSTQSRRGAGCPLVLVGRPGRLLPDPVPAASK